MASIYWLLLTLYILIQSTHEHEQEDWTLVSDYSLEEKTYYTTVQPSSVKKCQKVTDIILVKIKITYETRDDYLGPDMTTWSGYLNDFVFYNPRMEDDPTYLELQESFKKSDRYLVALLGTPIIVALIPVGFLIALFCAPIISMIGFRIGYLIFSLIFTSTLRRIIRQFFILSEKINRWKERRTQPYYLNLKQWRKHYYLPDVLRDFPEEEEPKELKGIQGTITVMVEESSSDIEEDLIYHEFFRPEIYKPKPVDIERIWEPTQEEILQITKHDKIPKVLKKFYETNRVDAIWKRDTEQHRARQIAKVRRQRHRLQHTFGHGRWGRISVRQPNKTLNTVPEGPPRKTSSDEIYEKLDAADFAAAAKEKEEMEKAKAQQRQQSNKGQKVTGSPKPNNLNITKPAK